jgi:phenylpyruvate tautomerase PptA (4-oxalocrotonate tautomerase family)
MRILPNVTIESYPRTTDQKSRLAKAITDDVVKIFEARPDDVRIEFIELPPTNIARGGKLGSENR